MATIKAKKPHAICIPFPAQGHLNPMMQLAKLLHSRGCHITFVNTEFNHSRFLGSIGSDALTGLKDFQFQTIPDGLSTSDPDATKCLIDLCESTHKNCLTPFLQLVFKLNHSPDFPQVTCIVADGVMSFGIQAAQELGIPGVMLWPAAACSFMAFLHFPGLVERGIVPFEDESCTSNGWLDITIDWIPGMKNIRFRDLPSYARTTDPNDFMFHFLGMVAQNCFKYSSSIIFNTFDDLEGEVLEAIASKFPHIYCLGPLSVLSQRIPESGLKSLQLSLWKQDSMCLDWLDKRGPKSVVYVNFGSVALLTDQQLIEFAWGLANSKHSFLWVLRPDIVLGNSATLPKEFTEETKDRCLLMSWCPQDLVLSHPSVGGFLTHCGWNSMIESICGGVPMICWPFVGEQHTNCRYACSVWGIGTEINEAKRQEIEHVVRELMEDKKGKEMRSKASEWKKKAEEGTKQGGSSYDNFDRFMINEVLAPQE